MFSEDCIHKLEDLVLQHAGLTYTKGFCVVRVWFLCKNCGEILEKVNPDVF